MRASDTKAGLRRQLLARRGTIAPADRKAAAQEVHRRVIESAPWSGAATVLAYAATGTELPTEGLLRAALDTGKVLVLPRVGDDGTLRLHAVPDLQSLSPGYRGILEPAPLLPEVAAAAVDLALVPGVAFDRRGGRLGYGGGCYDRILAQPGWRCSVWGVAFACQVVDELPLETHDHPVAAVVTEAGILRFHR